VSEPISITDARELFAKTTPGEWKKTFYEQPSQPVNERLLMAAKVADAHIGWGDCSLENVHVMLREAIAAEEAEIVERGKPVTEEWLQSFGWPLTNRLRLGFVAIPGKLSVFPPCGHLSSAVQFFDHITVDIKTRGDVLDLMRLLGGAT